MTEIEKKDESFEGVPEVPSALPILPVNHVIFPYIIAPLAVEDPKNVAMINEILTGNKLVALFAEREGKGSEGRRKRQLYSIGTMVTIIRMFTVPDGSLRLLVRGLSRIRLVKITQSEPFLKGTMKPVAEVGEKTLEMEALKRNATDLFDKMVNLSPNLPEELTVAVMNVQEPGRVADFIASNINLDLQEQQEILKTLHVADRLKKLTIAMNRELKVLELSNKIQTQVKKGMDKTQREYFLREQLKAIQEELGEGDERTMEINELREKISNAQMPQQVLEVAEKELNRLMKMPPAAAEYTVSRTYLDWLMALPWAKSTKDRLDMKKAMRILDKDHYGLDEIKDRIVEFIAVRKLKESTKGPILCFVGPPGVGKTSLGRSIARAMGRRFIRMSLGGMRDEAEIRGHRRTYVGALPGRIIQGIRQAGSNNPLFMLDEVDKIGMDFRGDPASALLEVLDPEQNATFSDHYLEVPFDLSRVMFVTTANILDTVPAALRDRMEVLSLAGYTDEEKFQIAKKYLIPKQLEENGLLRKQLTFRPGSVKRIIHEYTREAGLRNLEREIGSICRKVARRIAEGEMTSTSVTRETVPDYLGPRKFYSEVASRLDEVGVATGLAWTPVGGEVLFIESTSMRGGNRLSLTGHLGDVMKESAQAALSYLRSRADGMEISESYFSEHDLHIHVPAGAIPKDGPSAGLAIATSLVSLLTGKPVRRDVAMTGEITLRGRVLPVGGIKEKILAAHRAGIKHLILPLLNERDLEKVPEQIRKELTVTFVDTIDQAWNVALRDGAFRKAALTK
ncbi:MAG: endopeptidase La [Gemmatimonadota bacterium]|nr:MAG: endopeptidase La [Gemmatimonadota bacterium]